MTPSREDWVRARRQDQPLSWDRLTDDPLTDAEAVNLLNDLDAWWTRRIVDTFKEIREIVQRAPADRSEELETAIRGLERNLRSAIPEGEQ